MTIIDATPRRRASYVPYPRDAVPACKSADPELFFRQSTAKEKQAKAICQGCPLREPCFEYAIANAVDGVWGATTKEERAEKRAVQGVEARPVVTSSKVTQHLAAKPKEPRRSEVAMPGPAHGPFPVEVRYVQPTMEVPLELERRRQEPYDPRRPVLIGARRPLLEPRPGPPSKVAAPAPALALVPALEPKPAAETPAKFCPRCRETRPTTAFHPNKGNQDGLAVWCKSCFAELAARKAGT